MIYRHIGFLYSLTATLRRTPDDTSYLKFISESDLAKLQATTHIPNGLLRIQAEELKILREDGKVTDFEFFTLNRLIESFCDGMGKPERINNTVYPINYLFFTKLFIWLFIILITMATNMEVGWPSILLGWLMGFVFNTINLNGLTLMNPFENAPSGVPISSITRSIEITLLQDIGAKDIPEPLKPIDGEYIL